MKLIEVRKIWDKAPHNAFTDLIHFKNQWYCTFREGEDHVCDDGKIRVISSTDGKEWSSVTLLKYDGGDLRDPKFSITPNGQLMLNGAVRFIEPVDGNHHQSVTWFSSDGKSWSKSFACPTGLGTWRWSTTWNKDTAYSFAYGGKHKQGCLYCSKDGKTWTVVKDDVYPNTEESGNETSLIFLNNDKAYCLLRCNKGSFSAMLGSSDSPYTKWQWMKLGRNIGGPKMILIDDDHFLAAGRLYDGNSYTSLFWINPKKATIKEALKLPSDGDSSYAGLVLHDDGFVWASYYSSHEDKTAIYLAKVKI